MNERCQNAEPARSERLATTAHAPLALLPVKVGSIETGYLVAGSVRNAGSGTRASWPPDTVAAMAFAFGRPTGARAAAAVSAAPVRAGAAGVSDESHISGCGAEN